MIDFSRIVGFDWDDGNARKSLDKHGVTQAEAEQVFTGEPLLTRDVGHSEAEARFNALGETADGRLLHVTFTLRADDTKIRVISARDMNRKERVIHGQEA
jgi:uncharacterized protein